MPPKGALRRIRLAVSPLGIFSMRECVQCHEAMELEHFYRYYRGKDGYSPRCKQCHNKTVARYRRNVTTVTVDSKPCSRCKETKPAEMFCRSSISKYGLAGWCKECQKRHREFLKSKRPTVRDNPKPSLYDEVFRKRVERISVSQRFSEMLGRAKFAF